MRITVRAADHARMPDTDSTSTRASLHHQTVGEHLRKLAQHHPDRAALVARDQEYRATYAELVEQTDLAARGLMATGVARGDRVAIWAADRYERVLLGLAAARAGAILVAIDPVCDAAELGDALGATGARLLAMSRGCRGADHEALLQRVRHRCPQLRCVLMLDGEWHAFLEEGMHVSEYELVAREASVSPDDQVCMRPVAVTHRELLAGPGHATLTLGVGALAVILSGACVVVANRAPA